MRTHGFMIAAPQSGSGKTTVSLAVMAAFRRRGLTVAPFKCGPDFIDPGYHRAVTGQESINLDGWMCPEEFIGATFNLHSMDADIAVTEGAMGLFDGIGSSASEGSSAQIARLTGTPVVLVINARGMSASASALVRGFVEFDPGVKIAGVIFNNVGSATHGELLRAALASALPAIRVYGCVMRDESLVIPSRHLGLMTVEDNPLPADFIDRLVAMAEACLDLDGLAQLCSSSEPQPQNRSPLSREKPVRIAVARDAAFCFVYPDNLRLLCDAGSELIEFSPLVDSTLPPDIAGIYLPGGYPELYAGQLAANSNMLEAIREAVENDMPLYAECGGLIYLTEGMEGGAALAGIFPVRARMLDKRKALGYRQVEMREDTIMGEAGSVSRGHEFHYSEIGAMPERIARTFRISRRGEDLGVEGYCYRNCLASYVHLHFGSNPGLAAWFINSCRDYGNRNHEPFAGRGTLQ